MADYFIAEAGNRSFAIFNVDELSDEPVTDADMIAVEAHGDEMNAARSATWSSNAWWYFVVLNDGIILMSVDTNRGVMCRKKSWKFIDAFVNR